MTAIPLTFTLFALAYAGSEKTQSSLDHAAWGRVLLHYENQQARVDYASLKKNGSPDLQTYIAQLAAPLPKSFTPNERKAALINAYNALTVNWIAQHYPLQSIWRTNHPFTEARNLIDGRKLSLEQIEGELRNLGDPRIHASLVCASISCPPLRREPYLAAELDRQLDDNTRAWLSNPALNRFDSATREAHVSMIFDWYKDDFAKSGSSVPAFLAKFAPPAQSAFLNKPGLKISFLEYNWGLNDTSAIGANYSKSSFYADYLRNKL